MNLQKDLEDILSGAKEIGGDLLTGLVNATGNPTLAAILYDLIGSHVEVAKQVQKTPPGQQALAALKAKQAAAVSPAPAASPAPASSDATAAALASIAQALAGINAKLDAQAAPSAPAAAPAVEPTLEG